MPYPDNFDSKAHAAAWGSSDKPTEGHVTVFARTVEELLRISAEETFKKYFGPDYTFDTNAWDDDRIRDMLMQCCAEVIRESEQ